MESNVEKKNSGLSNVDSRFKKYKTTYVAGVLIWGECERCYMLKSMFWVTVGLLK